MKTKIILWIVAVTIILVIITLMFIILSGSSTLISELAFSEISLIKNENKVILCGSLISSAKSYRSYSYRIEGETLVIKIKSGLVNFVYPHGDFRIEFMHNKISNINNIVIESGKDIISIYP